MADVQIIDTFVPEISGFDSVVDTEDVLKVTTASGVLYVDGLKVFAEEFEYTYPDDRDTYDDIDANGTVTHTSVDNGALEPPRAASTTRLQKVIATSGAISSVTKMVPHNWDRNVHVAGRGYQAREANETISMLERDVRYVGDSIYDDGDIVDGCDILINSDKTQASMSAGRVYLQGKRRDVAAATIDITGSGTEHIGVQLVFSNITEEDDKFLRDPATNLDGSGLPGAYRRKATVTWLLSDFDEDVLNAAVVYTLEDGDVLVQNPPTQFTNIEDKMARHTWLESGHFRVEGLDGSLTQVEGDDQNLLLTVSAGTGFVYGREITKKAASNLTWRKVIDTNRVTESATFTNTTQVYTVGRPPVQSVDSVDAIFTTPVMRITKTGSATENVPLISVVDDTGAVGATYQTLPATSALANIRIWASDPGTDNPASWPAVTYTEDTTSDQSDTGADYYRGSGDNIIWKSGKGPGSGTPYYLAWNYHSDNGTTGAVALKGTRVLHLVSNNVSGFDGPTTVEETVTYYSNTTTTLLANADIQDIISVTGASSGGDPANFIYRKNVDWEIDTGRTNTAVGTGGIKWLRPKVTAPVDATNLTVEYRYWDHTIGLYATSNAEGEYVSADSYLEQSDTYGTIEFPGVNSNKYRIAYERIGSYGTGLTTPEEDINLRNSIDFRPTSGGYPARAPLNNAAISYTYNTFQPRSDLVVLRQDGEIEIIYGVPSTQPRFPAIPSDVLPLFTITANPNDQIPTIKPNSIDRLTMQDLQFLRNRVETLEQLSRNQLLTREAESSGGVDIAATRGIFVDPLRGFSRTDTKFTYWKEALNPGDDPNTVPTNNVLHHRFDSNGKGVWAVNTTYAVGDVIKPTGGVDTGHYYICTVAGISGPSEPTWADSLNDATKSITYKNYVDNTATWTAFTSSEHIFYTIGMDLGSETLTLPMWYDPNPVEPIRHVDYVNTSVQISDFSQAWDDPVLFSPGEHLWVEDFHGQALSLPYTEQLLFAQSRRAGTWNPVPGGGESVQASAEFFGREVWLNPGIDTWVDTNVDPALSLKIQDTDDYAFITEAIQSKGGAEVVNLPDVCLRGRLSGWHRLFHVGTPTEFIRNPSKDATTRYHIITPKGLPVGVFDPENPDYHPVLGQKTVGFVPIGLTVTQFDNTQRFGDNVISTDIIPFARERLVSFMGAQWDTSNKVGLAIQQRKAPIATFGIYGQNPEEGAFGVEQVKPNSEGRFGGYTSIPLPWTQRNGWPVYGGVVAGTSEFRFSEALAITAINARHLAYVSVGSLMHNREAMGSPYSYSWDAAKPTGSCAQSFRFGVQRMVTGVDLYFGSKSSTRGVTVHLRNMENGFPGTTILGRAHRRASQINTSSDGKTATRFTFTEPVYVRNDEDVALVLIIDSTEFTLHRTEGVTQGIAGKGSLFQSKNGTTWELIVDKDLKYGVYGSVLSAHSATFQTTEMREFFGSGVILTGSGRAQPLSNWTAQYAVNNTTNWIPTMFGRESQLDQIVRGLKVRIDLSASENWTIHGTSPVINPWSVNAVGFCYSGVRDIKDPDKIVADYVTKNYEISTFGTDIVEQVKIITDEYQPPNTDIEWYISTDNGIAWRKLPNSSADATSYANDTGFDAGFTESLLGDNQIKQRTREFEFFKVTNTKAVDFVSTPTNTNAAGGVIPSGAYDVTYTTVTDIGESAAATINTVNVISSNGDNTITIPANTITLQGADAARVYAAVTATGPYFVEELTPLETKSAYVITSVPNSGAIPPSTSQAATINSGPSTFRLRCRMSSSATEPLVPDPVAYANTNLTDVSGSGALAANTTFYVAYSLEIDESAIRGQTPGRTVLDVTDSFGRPMSGYRTGLSPVAQITTADDGDVHQLNLTLPGGKTAHELSFYGAKANFWVSTDGPTTGFKLAGSTENFLSGFIVFSDVADLSSTVDYPRSNQTKLFTADTPQVSKIRVILHDSLP